MRLLLLRIGISFSSFHNLFSNFFMIKAPLSIFWHIIFTDSIFGIFTSCLAAGSPSYVCHNNASTLKDITEKSKCRRKRLSYTYTYVHYITLNLQEKKSKISLS